MKKREQKQTPFPHTVLLSEGNALNRLPLFENLAFPCCPVSQVGEDGNERLKTENQSRFVCKVDVDFVMTTLDMRFYAFNRLALGLFKVDVYCVSLGSFVTLIFSHDARSLCVRVRAMPM